MNIVTKTFEIFKEYDEKLKNNENIDCGLFEKELIKLLDIKKNNHQEVKDIILEFYKCNFYKDICYEYAKYFKVIEFHDLIDDYEKGSNSSKEIK